MKDNKTTREHISEHINNFLKDKNISLREFASEIGVTYSSVKRWCDGICAPDIDLLPGLCKYMDVSINELLGIEGNPSLSPSQQDFVNRYQQDESFRNLCNKFRDDTEIRVSLSTLIQKIK